MVMNLKNRFDKCQALDSLFLWTTTFEENSQEPDLEHVESSQG
jgi:hypothetical protein